MSEVIWCENCRMRLGIDVDCDIENHVHRPLRNELEQLVMDKANLINSLEKQNKEFNILLQAGNMMAEAMKSGGDAGWDKAIDNWEELNLVKQGNYSKDILDKLYYLKMDNQCDCYICEIASEAIVEIKTLKNKFEKEQKMSDVLSFLLAKIHPKCEETIVCDICDALADYWAIR